MPIAAALLSCSAAGTADGGPGAGTGAAGATGAGADTGIGASTATGTGGDSTGFINVGGTTNGGPTTTGDACNAVSSAAEKVRGGKADIIWAIDNSGSMTEEAAAVQTKLNEFSTFIASTGIDVHVVLISDKPAPALIPGIISLVNGICVDPPLGAAGACPSGDDTNIPGGYMHWLINVDSHNALSRIETTFTGWRGMLRPDSTKTFVVVSDDEANPPPDPTADTFIAWANAQPEIQGALWRFSGVFCVPGQPVTSNCANVGNTYGELVTKTGGVAAALGQPVWDAIFKELADAVIKDSKPVDCEWAIPPAPMGQTLDKNKVNVQFTPSSGVTEPLFAVDHVSQCSDAFLGWHYDNKDAPTRVLACPQTCPKLQADTSARVEVLFGCATTPPPLQ